MAEGVHHQRTGRARRILLFALSPLWAPPFLLVQAIGLCADGLLQVAGGRRGHITLRGPWRWVVGTVGLVVFPLLVGLRGLGIVIIGLGRGAARFFGRPAAGRPAVAVLGIAAAILLPVWLPVALVVWLGRWVLWGLLVPEFERGLGHGPARGGERLVTFVGLRYLFGRRETALHSATTYYAAAGIALGVCALIVVLAVMSGFNTEVKERIVGTNAHVILLRFGLEGMAGADSLAGAVARHPEVVAVAPFVYGKAMLTASDAAEGAVVKGIRWADEVGVTAVGHYVRDAGGVPALARDANGRPGIILGEQIAANMGLLVGEEVTLVSPAASRRTPLGYVPRMRRFRVAGIFDSGMYEFDATLAFIDLVEAQSFFGLGDRVTGLEVRIRDMDRAPVVANELLGVIGGFPYRANNWIDLNENLFSWMRLEKRAMFVILIMIIMVAGFSIASSLIMLVTEKRREIGILKSMGATSMGILRIFVLEGWVTAFSGATLGTGVGLALCYALDRYRFIRLPADVYFIDTLPVRVELGDVGWITASVLVIAALSTLYPAWRAARLDPIEAIRSE
jgi:lipoprotein-releasing system permease protein